MWWRCSGEDLGQTHVSLRDSRSSEGSSIQGLKPDAARGHRMGVPLEWNIYHIGLPSSYPAESVAGTTCVSHLTDVRIRIAAALSY